ncbi:MAG: ATP-binding cassette domain-containing protein, partial [Clostridia bacterium]|nr:ATP-binding cassette domain-containing protein [Clostridia bacterium]
MEYVLETDALTKRYRKFTALNGLSMHVPKGSIYGFVGRNGAGKTTLIRLICGLQEPTDGSFKLYGAQSGTKEIYKARRRIGALVETPAIYRDMTAKENLKQQYRVLGLPSFDGIEELLALVGLSDSGKKKAGHFSLGMRQRLAIAIALCGDPDFLVLDEPMNGLDPQGIIEMRELILKLNREKQVTVLVSSHILDELSKVATHYGFIDKGSIIKEMSAEELEMRCGKCVRVEVSNIKTLSYVLDSKGFEYKIIDNSKADIYADFQVTKLVSALEKENCIVYGIKEHD